MLKGKLAAEASAIAGVRDSATAAAQQEAAALAQLQGQVCSQMGTTYMPCVKAHLMQPCHGNGKPVMAIALQKAM